MSDELAEAVRQLRRVADPKVNYQVLSRMTAGVLVAELSRLRRVEQAATALVGHWHQLYDGQTGTAWSAKDGELRRALAEAVKGEAP